MKTVIFISKGRHEGIENVESYRYRQGRQSETGTDRDTQRQAGTSMDRQGKVTTSRDRDGMSLLVPVCACLVPACPFFVPACPCAVPGIDWHNW